MLNLKQDFENKVNKSESIKKKVAAASYKLATTKDVLADIKSKQLAAANGALQSTAIAGKLAEAGLLVKETNSHAVYVHLENMREQVQSSITYSYSFEEVTVNDDDYPEGSTFDCKLTAYDVNGDVVNGVRVQATFMDSFFAFVNDTGHGDYDGSNVKTLNLMSGATVSVYTIESNSFFNKEMKMIPVTADGIPIEGGGAIDIFKYSMFSVLKETGAKFNTYSYSDGVSGDYDSWNGNAFGVFLGANNVTAGEIENIIYINLADTKYEKTLKANKQMSFTTSPQKSIGSNAIDLPSFEDCVRDLVEMIRNMIDEIMNLSDFRKQIETCLSGITYEKNITVGNHFVFLYDLKGPTMATGAPITYLTETKYFTELWVQENIEGVDVERTAVDTYGQNARTIVTDMSVRAMYHAIYDSSLGYEFVESIISEHEKSASSGVGGILASINLKTADKLVSAFASSSLSKLKQKALSQASSKVDSFKLKDKTKELFNKKKKSESSNASLLATTSGTTKLADTKTFTDTLLSVASNSDDLKTTVEDIKKNTVNTCIRGSQTAVYAFDDLKAKVEAIIVSGVNTAYLLCSSYEEIHDVSQSIGISQNKYTMRYVIYEYNFLTKNKTVLYEEKGDIFTARIQQDVKVIDTDLYKYVIFDRPIETPMSCLVRFIKDPATSYYKIDKNFFNIHNALTHVWDETIGLNHMTADEKGLYTDNMLFTIDNITAVESTSNKDMDNDYFFLHTSVVGDVYKGISRIRSNQKANLIDRFTSIYMGLKIPVYPKYASEPEAITHTLISPQVIDYYGYDEYCNIEGITTNRKENAHLFSLLIGRKKIQLSAGQPYLNSSDVLFVNNQVYYILNGTQTKLVTDTTVYDSVVLVESTNNLYNRLWWILNRYNISNLAEAKITRVMENIKFSDEAPDYKIQPDNDILNMVYDYTNKKYISTFARRSRVNNIDVVTHYTITHINITTNTEYINNILITMYDNKPILKVKGDGLYNPTQSLKINDSDYFITGYMSGSPGYINEFDTSEVKALKSIPSGCIFKYAAEEITKLTTRLEAPKATAVSATDSTKMDSNKGKDISTSISKESISNAVSGSESKVKEVMSSSNTTSITVDISFFTNTFENTITCEGITLKKIARLSETVEAQQEMFNDIMNALSAAKAKLDSSANIKKDYFVSNYSPK